MDSLGKGSCFRHNFSFDPSYGLGLAELLQVGVDSPPDDFEAFWCRRYSEARRARVEVEWVARGSEGRWRVCDLRFTSTGGFVVGGWGLVPMDGVVRRGLVVGHGYGGREGPDFEIGLDDAVVLFPCGRGFGRSSRSGLPDTADSHVLCGIEDPESYLLGACVEDIWNAVTALLALYPGVEGEVYYCGESFGGGLGALAVPWDERFQRAYFGVPTFGAQRLRVELPSVGSASAVRAYVGRNAGCLERTLVYFDAAFAALFARVPVMCSCALFDPFVPPPTQFAVYNALRSELRRLHIIPAAHFEYGEQERHWRERSEAVWGFLGGIR